MSDTLEVFGQEYTGVEGFKATDSNGDTQRYVNANQFLPLIGGTLTGALEIQNGGITIPNSSYGYFALDSNGAEQCLTYMTAGNYIRIGSANNTNVNGITLVHDTNVLGTLDVDGATTLSSTLSVGGHITMPISKSLKGLDSNGTAKTLIYLAANNNVRINSDTSGVTQIVSNTEVTGTVTSTGTINSSGGALVANNCTSYNGGVAGGFISTGGRLALVSSASTTYPQVMFVTNKSTTAYTQLRATNTSGTYTVTLPASTGTLAISSSDIRLKENIKDTEVSGLDLITKIKLHEFDWKAEGRAGSPHWKVGVIADELEELDPNLATGGGYEEDGSMNIKSIEIPYLLGYVIKAVQELSQEIIRLKNGGE